MSVSFLDRITQSFRNLPIVRAGMTVLGWEEVAAGGVSVLDRQPVFADFSHGDARLAYFVLEMEGEDPIAGIGAPGTRWYKAVYPVVLEYLPRQMRDQTTVLQRFAKVLKGLYNARVDLLVMVAGMFGQLGERPLGLVQAYAAQGTGATKEEAVDRGRETFTALLANLRTIPQARFVPMAEEERAFLLRAFTDFEHVLVAIGQPDPRKEATRAIGERRVPGKEAGEETLEQNEILYRGMQAAGLDFANLTMATCVPRESIFRLEQRFREEATLWLSRVQGQKSIALNFAIPTIFSGMDTRGMVTSYEAGRSHVVSTGTAHTEGSSVSDGHTVGVAHTAGRTETETRGRTHTEGESWGSMSSAGGSRTESTGTAHSEGTAHSDGIEHSVTRSSTSGGSSSESHTTGRTETNSVTQVNTVTDGQSHAEGSAEAHGESHQSGWQASATVGHGSADGVSASQQRTESREATEGSADRVGGSVTAGGGVGIPLVAEGHVDVTASYDHTWNRSHSTGESTAEGTGTQHTESHDRSATAGISGGSTTSDTHTASIQDATSHARTSGTNVTHAESVIVDQVTTSHSSMSSSTRGETNGETHSETRSQQDTASQGLAIATMWAAGSSHERSVSEAESESHASSLSEADTRSEGWSHEEGRSTADSTSQGTAEGLTTGAGRSFVASQAGGLTAGLTGGVSLVKSYAWNDATAQKVADLLQRQLLLLDSMERTGAFLVEGFWFVPTIESARALAGLFVSAFHGETDNVVTPARLRLCQAEEVAHIRPCAMSFSFTTRRERALGVFEGLRDANLLPMLGLSALVSPAIYEGGRATTTKEAVPPYAIYGPGMLRGDVSLGNFISYETGAEVPIPYLLSEDRMGHWGIFGDSGYGKSEATMYFLWAVNVRWNLPVVVFDWGLNYRKLLKVTPQERFVFHSLYPSGPRRVRWNPLQFVLDVDPETQMALTVDVVCNAGGLGERQKGFLRDTLRRLYLEAGALTFDAEQISPTEPDRADATRTAAEEYQRRLAQARLSESEVQQLRAVNYRLPQPDSQGHTWLRDCPPDVRHQVAVWRSRPVDFGQWFHALRRLLLEKEARKQARDVEALQGILNRLNALASGRLAEMYAAIREGEPALDITRVMFPPEGKGRSGERARIAVFEGGTMGESEKAILFGLMIAQIYEAARVRYRRSLGTGRVPRFVLAIEEANKVVVSASQAKQQQAVASTSELFSSLARDSRKYGIYLMWLGQSPSAFPPEIVSSCTNFAIFRLKIGPDRELLTEAMAKVSSGLVSPEYLMHLSRLPVGQAVIVLGRTTDEVLVEPSLVHTNVIPGDEPGDDALVGMDG